MSTKNDARIMNYYNCLALSRGIKMRCITLTGLIICGDFFFKVFFAFSLITLSSYNRTELGISFLILKSLVMVASALKKECSTVVILRDLRDTKEIYRVNARWQARSLTQIWQLPKLVLLIILSLHTWSFFLSCAESPQILSWTAL